MTKKRTKDRGILTIDPGVYPDFIKSARASGWSVRKISKTMENMSDEFIAREYGEKRSVLFTHDKTAYTHNVSGGFIGYIEHDSVSKEEYNNYKLKVDSVLSSLTSKDVRKYRIKIQSRSKKPYEKEPLPVKYLPNKKD